MAPLALSVAVAAAAALLSSPAGALGDAEALVQVGVQFHEVSEYSQSEAMEHLRVLKQNFKEKKIQMVESYDTPNKLFKEIADHQLKDATAELEHFEKSMKDAEKNGINKAAIEKEQAEKQPLLVLDDKKATPPNTMAMFTSLLPMLNHLGKELASPPVGPPNKLGVKMDLALSGYRKGDVLVHVDKGCVTEVRDGADHLVCTVHPGDNVKSSITNNFGKYQFVEGDTFDMQLSGKVTGVPLIGDANPFANETFHLKCPMCGAKCNIVFEDVLPGGMERLSPAINKMPYALQPFFAGIHDQYGYAITLPPCPLSLPDSVLLKSGNQQLPTALPSFLLPLFRNLEGHTRIKVHFRHADGTEIFGVSQELTAGQL